MRLLQIWFILLALIFSFDLQAQEEVYELRTYQLTFFRPADVLHNYFETALIPALNRQGVQHVGAFEEAGDALPKKVYLLISYPNIQTYFNSGDVLMADSDYLAAAETYLKAPEASIAYVEYTTELIRSALGFPNLKKPPANATYYELRIYPGHNEDALRRKVKMFNDHEFQIFEEVGLPMVFFGDNIAGTHMPCLTYLLAFENKEAHALAWSRFRPHPEWQRILKLDEFANSMNEIIRVFLKPLPYSQI